METDRLFDLPIDIERLRECPRNVKIIDAIISGIMNQREEILKAFIAKYGCGPDEITQSIEVTEKGIEWKIILNRPLTKIYVR